jgi:hypothetical protein
VGLKRGPLSLVRINEELLERNVMAPVCMYVSQVAPTKRRQLATLTGQLAFGTSGVGKPLATVRYGHRPSGDAEAILTLHDVSECGLRIELLPGGSHRRTHCVTDVKPQSS